MLRRKLVIALTVLAAAAFAGVAYAATQSSGSRQDFLNDVAKRLHVTPAQLRSALDGAYQDQLNAAVKSGRLTQAQANALAQRLKNRGGVPLKPFGLGPGPAGPKGPGGPGFPGPGGPRGRGFAGPGGVLGAAASYLGLTGPQLLDQMSSGKSLAQIAQARHKSVSGLEQAIESAFKTRLDQAVARGAITSAQERKQLSNLNSRVDALVNRTRPSGPRGPRAWGPPPPGGPNAAPGSPRPGAFAPGPPAPGQPA